MRVHSCLFAHTLARPRGNAAEGIPAPDPPLIPPPQSPPGAIPRPLSARTTNASIPKHSPTSSRPPTAPSNIPPPPRRPLPQPPPRPPPPRIGSTPNLRLQQQQQHRQQTPPTLPHPATPPPRPPSHPPQIPKSSKRRTNKRGTQPLRAARRHLGGRQAAEEGRAPGSVLPCPHQPTTNHRFCKATNQPPTTVVQGQGHSASALH